uniref:MAM domain-containing protein n=1 Tax=Ciona intestinalis TaxID=7719 RepID=F6TLI7_CIOIN
MLSYIFLAVFLALAVNVNSIQNFDCDFSSGTLCPGWSQKPFDHHDWTVRNPSTIQERLDPLPSHSIRYGGPFAHINASRTGWRFSRTTTLVSPLVVLEAGKEYCLDFWFYQRNTNYGERLNLYAVNHVNVQSLFQSFVSFQDTWNNGLAQVKGQGSKIKFEFEAISGRYIRHTNVGLDNITLYEGQCPPFRFNCSFDLPNPLCPGWTTSSLDPINPEF